MPDFPKHNTGILLQNPVQKKKVFPPKVERLWKVGALLRKSKWDALIARELRRGTRGTEGARFILSLSSSKRGPYFSCNRALQEGKLGRLP
jgi:hypothetical protein